MNPADFNFSSSMGHSMRDPLPWSHEVPAENLVFKAHDIRGFSYSNPATNRAPWAGTNSGHHQLSTHNSSESSSDMVTCP